MKELIYALRLGAQISRGRNLNLDYATMAEQAADAIERLENEALAATLRIENDKQAMHQIGLDLIAIQDIHDSQKATLYLKCAELQKEVYARNGDVVALMKERDKLLADNASLVRDKESDRIAYLAMRDERDALQAKLLAFESRKYATITDESALVLEEGKYHRWEDEDGIDWEWFGRDVECDTCIDVALVRADKLAALIAERDALRDALNYDNDVAKLFVKGEAK